MRCQNEIYIEKHYQLLTNKRHGHDLSLYIFTLYSCRNVHIRV